MSFNLKKHVLSNYFSYIELNQHKYTAESEKISLSHNL